MVPKNQWYAILESKDIKDKPVSIQRFGEKLIVWRNSSGQISCFLNRCAHRAAVLSRGQFKNDCIKCPLHGFEYNSDGDCVLIPSDGRSAKVSPTLKLKKFLAKEKHDFVWIWYSDSENEIAEIPWFSELERQSFLPISSQYELPISLYRTMEACLDYAHFQFVHSFFKIKGAGPRAKGFKTAVSDDRIDISGAFAPDDEESPGVPFNGAVIFPALSMTAAPTNTGDTNHFMTAACPIDAHTTWVAFKFLVPSGSSLLIKAKVSLQQAVFAKVIFPILTWQDQKIWKDLSDFPKPGSEKLLANADGGIVEYQKIWRMEMREARGIVSTDRLATTRGPQQQTVTASRTEKVTPAEL